MKTFYVSLVKDLLHVYLAFQAESEQAVRQYLVREYLYKRTFFSSGSDQKVSVWKLPWGAVYEELPKNPMETPIVIRAAYCGDLYEE